VRLQQFVHLELSTDVGELPALFGRAIERLGPHRQADRRAELDLAGAARIEQIVAQDLGLTG
jgi:hypothetical protein